MIQTSALSVGPNRTLRTGGLFFPHEHRAGHRRSLDGLRGLAILIVLLSHAGLNFHAAFIFERYGKVGVFGFFVLSAYLLDFACDSLLRDD